MVTIYINWCDMNQFSFGQYVKYCPHNDNFYVKIEIEIARLTFNKHDKTLVRLKG